MIKQRSSITLLAAFSIILVLLTCMQPAPASGQGDDGPFNADTIDAAALSITIPASDDVPAFDGTCTAAEYSDAISVSFAAEGVNTMVYLKHTDVYLYVCFHNAPSGAGFAAVFVDSDYDGDPALDNNDFILRQPHNGGARSGNYFSTFSNAYNGPNPSGWSSRFNLGDITHDVEFQLTRTLLGGWQRSVGISLAHVNGSINSGWPAGNLAFTPGLWGRAFLQTGRVAIPQSSLAPIMDGQCSSFFTPNEYNDGAAVQFNLPSGSATAHFKHTDTDLWICLEDLNTPYAGMRDKPNAVVKINRLGGIGGDEPSADDMYFGISYSGIVSSARGSMDGFHGPEPGDFAAQRYLDGDFLWQAEFRISRDAIGGWGHNILIAAAQEQYSPALDDYAWPRGYNQFTPNTWATASLPTTTSGILDIQPAFSGSSIEVTQAIQDMNNSVVLVAGKRTFARAYFRLDTPRSVLRTTARLYGYRNGRSLGPPLMPVSPDGESNVISAPNRAMMSDAFLFELPAQWIEAGTITLRAVANPYIRQIERSYDNNTVESGPITFIESKPLRLQMRNIRYITSGGMNVSARQLDYDLLTLQVRRMYPIPFLYVSRRDIISLGFVQPQIDGPPVIVNPLRDDIFNAADYVNSLLARDREAMGRSAQGWLFYGMVHDGGGFMRGKANWSWFNSTSIEASGPTGPTPIGLPSGVPTDNDGSYGDWIAAHEIGHSLGQHHADFCGAESSLLEPNYPYDLGRIGGPGSNVGRYMGIDSGAPWFGLPFRVLNGLSWFDIMSYCPDLWVSDYFYSNVHNYLQASDYFDTLSRQSGTVIGGNFLRLYGIIDTERQTAELLYAARETAVNQIPPIQPGDYHIRLYDESNTLLADHAFTPAVDVSSENMDTGAFHQVVSLAAETRRVTIYSEVAGTDLAAFTISANAPSVTNVTHSGGAALPAAGSVTIDWQGHDADGDPLVYDVYYSFDEGANWRLIAAGIEEESITVDGAQLEGTGGTAAGLLRVLASDGVLTGKAESEHFSVAGKDPEVIILDPLDDSTYVYGQIVALEGQAQDFEDGTLTGGSMQWRSDLDGDLGSGHLLHPAILSVGMHHITLQATDSHGQTAEATVRIIIVADLGDTGPLLSAGPSPIAFVAQFNGENPVAQTISVRNDGYDRLNWTADSSGEWLSLSAVSGSAPADINVSVDIGGLPVGWYSGAVKVTGGEAAETINVSLRITGSQIYLPVAAGGQ